MWDIIGELAANNAIAGLLLVLLIAGLLWIKGMAVRYAPKVIEYYTKHVLALEKQNTEMERMNDISDKMLIAVDKCEDNRNDS